jgi:hypothetical protein
MVDESQQQADRLQRDRAEDALTDLVGGIGGRLQEYVKEWIAAFDAAISGEYDAQRLVADASRMTTRMIRDTAELFVTGFDVLNILGSMQGRGGGEGGQAPAKAEPR